MMNVCIFLSLSVSLSWDGNGISAAQVSMNANELVGIQCAVVNNGLAEIPVPIRACVAERAHDVERQALAQWSRKGILGDERPIQVELAQRRRGAVDACHDLVRQRDRARSARSLGNAVR